MKKVAIVYHYLALYRMPIFSELMHSTNIEYTLYSGRTSEFKIAKIDSEFSTIDINSGGLRWEFLKNRWVFNKKFLWQSGLLKTALFESFDSYIFLGSPYHLSTWIATIIVRLRGKKSFFWMHGVYRDKLGLVDHIKLKIFYKLPTGFFLYGNRSLSILKKFNVKSDTMMHVIYNSLNYNESLKYRRIVSSEEVSLYRRKYFGDEEVPVIVFIGRLNDAKKLDMLINAREILNKVQGSNLFNILIIGDGENKDTLVNQVSDLGLQNHVRFLGAVYDEALNAECIMFADLCVTPGEVGLTAIHAMSYGTPVISHDNLNLQMPEVESIVCGVTGDLYKYNDVDDLANKINQWFDVNQIKSTELMNNCFNIIDSYYNPNFQCKVLDEVLNK